MTTGIAVVLLLTVGTGVSTVLLNTAYAQTVTTTLGEPFFVEKGKTTGQKEISSNTTQFTFTSNGMLKGDIEVTDTGEGLSVSKGNNLTYYQGQGVIKTKDGSEMANYTFIEVSNGTVFQGAAAYSTNSTGKLSFLNNILGILKGEEDESGNFLSTEWHWK